MNIKIQNLADYLKAQGFDFAGFDPLGQYLVKELPLEKVLEGRLLTTQFTPYAELLAQLNEGEYLWEVTWNHMEDKIQWSPIFRDWQIEPLSYVENHGVLEILGFYAVMGQTTILTVSDEVANAMRGL